MVQKFFQDISEYVIIIEIDVGKLGALAQGREIDPEVSPSSYKLLISTTQSFCLLG